MTTKQGIISKLNLKELIWYYKIFVLHGGGSSEIKRLKRNLGKAGLIAKLRKDIEEKAPPTVFWLYP